ncbi:Hsp70 family protein [Micromonospora pattaloongensis]|nr:Hsp70 family protein [Micromonospora pattaloongensis]
MSDSRSLVVDFGTSSSAAAVVTGDTMHLVAEPITGSYTWPSAVHWDGQHMFVGSVAERRKRAEPTAYAAEFKRGLAADVPVPLGDRRFRPVEQVVAVLATLRGEAEHLHGGRIERAVITVPASYAVGDPRRGQMIAAGEAAGFHTVELLSEPVAAAFAPVAGAPLTPGELVLVYDLGGGTFDTALVRVGEHGHEVLGHVAIDNCGGRDIDALLAARIHDEGREWLEPLLAAAATDPTGPAALRMEMAVTDFARRIKHQLSEVEEVEDFLMPNTPAYRMTRDDLASLAAPLLDQTVACCQSLLDELVVGVSEVDAVLLVGGGARMPAVIDTVRRAFERPLRHVDEPELATVRGAARWLGHSGSRTVLPSPASDGSQPLSFAVPGRARLLRWLVGPGDAYPAGATLARVRLQTGALWDLTAATAGTIERLLVAPGAEIAPQHWLALARPTTVDRATPPATTDRATPPATAQHGAASTTAGRGAEPATPDPAAGPATPHDAAGSPSPDPGAAPPSPDPAAPPASPDPAAAPASPDPQPA